MSFLDRPTLNEPTVSDEVTIKRALAYESEQELGSSVTLIKAATKDRFGEPLTSTTVTLTVSFVKNFHARDIAEMTGWIQEVDIVLYVSRTGLISAGLTFVQLKNDYREVNIGGYRYELNHTALEEQFQNDAIYYMIGANKR